MSGVTINLDDVKEESIEGYLGAFNDHDDLVAQFPTAEFGQLATTINAQGTPWLPWNLGGTYYPEGTYVWDGTKWKTNTENISVALQELEEAKFKVQANSADLVPSNLQQKINDTNDIFKQITPPFPAGDEKIQFLLRPRNYPVESNVNPTVNDDNTDPTLHRIGQTWINTIKKTSYVAMSLESGAAIWKRTSIDQFMDEVASLSRPSQTTIGLINNQNNIFETYLTKTFVPVDTDNFTVEADFIWSLDDAGDDIIVTLNITDGAAFNETILMETEPKDVGGGGLVLNILQGGVIVGSQSSGTNQRNIGILKKDFILNEGVSYTVTLQWTSTDSNLQATLYDATLSVKQNTINE